MRVLKTVTQQGNHYGWLFECPGCEHAHVFYIDGSAGNPTWEFNGDTNNPTFTPSLLNTTNTTRCHLFVTDGKIRFLSDCTHSLAGQTVDLPEINDWRRA